VHVRQFAFHQYAIPGVDFSGSRKINARNGVLMKSKLSYIVTKEEGDQHGGGEDEEKEQGRRRGGEEGGQLMACLFHTNMFL